jgi:hypothetical protein
MLATVEGERGRLVNWDGPCLGGRVNHLPSVELQGFETLFSHYLLPTGGGDIQKNRTLVSAPKSIHALATANCR